MIRAVALVRSHDVHVELSADPRFAGRLVRLAATSVVALGAIALLARTTLAAPAWVQLVLAAGWVTMPIVLVASLRRPLLRYALAVPSALVTLGLAGACTIAIRDGTAPATAGWLLVTAGVLLGGVLGAWFWFRLLPVPASLADPFSPGRWALVGVHVALIVAGLAIVALAALL